MCKRATPEPQGGTRGHTRLGKESAAEYRLQFVYCRPRNDMGLLSSARCCTVPCGNGSHVYKGAMFAMSSQIVDRQGLCKLNY